MPLEWFNEEHTYFTPWVRCYLPDEESSGLCLVYTITEAKKYSRADQQYPLGAFLDIAHWSGPPGLQIAFGNTIDEVKEAVERAHHLLLKLFGELIRKEETTDPTQKGVQNVYRIRDWVLKSLSNDNASLIGKVVEVKKPGVVVALITIIQEEDKHRVAISPPDESALYYMPEFSEQKLNTAVIKINKWASIANPVEYLRFRAGKIKETMEIK